jgi:hypothetical protein
VLGVTDDLDEGTYEYRTYLVVDGNKEYSEGLYEFTVKRINQVVPEWILEKMEPYIPIYEGDNPPVVEGVYLVTPMTLFYNSDPNSSYRPGKVFADLYMYLYDQDKVNNSINYLGYEVNSYGETIAEEYGQGAFISGEGLNFSIFFNTISESYYSDGVVPSKKALIISGTKTSTGIRDVYYSFVMIDKDDPHGHLMDVGDFRVFKDGDGFVDMIGTGNGSRSRGIWTNKSLQRPMVDK